MKEHFSNDTESNRNHGNDLINQIKNSIETHTNRWDWVDYRISEVEWIQSDYFWIDNIKENKIRNYDHKIHGLWDNNG